MFILESRLKTKRPERLFVCPYPDCTFYMRYVLHTPFSVSTYHHWAMCQSIFAPKILAVLFLFSNEILHFLHRMYCRIGLQDVFGLAKWPDLILASPRSDMQKCFHLWF